MNLPFSSRHMVECLNVGAEKFGWSQRTPQVGSMKKDGLILGWGVAGCSWIAERQGTEATVDLHDDGTARVSCATQDIGTGTYTVLSQIVSERTGIPNEKIEVVLGDTALPPGPISGGSWATASVIPAVVDAIEKAQQTLFVIASQSKEPGLAGQKPELMAFTDGCVHLKDKSPDTGVTLRADSYCRQHPRRLGPGKVRGHPWRSKQQALHALLRSTVCRGDVAA